MKTRDRTTWILETTCQVRRKKWGRRGVLHIISAPLRLEMRGKGLVLRAGAAGAGGGGGGREVGCIRRSHAIILWTIQLSLRWEQFDFEAVLACVTSAARDVHRCTVCLLGRFSSFLFPRPFAVQVPGCVSCPKTQFYGWRLMLNTAVFIFCGESALL